MFKIFFIITIPILFCVQNCKCTDLDQLDSLIKYLKTNSNSKIGFLSKSNYASVKHILPHNIAPVIVDHEIDLVKRVINNTLVAALISGQLSNEHNKYLHVFSSSVVTLHSILMAPEKTFENPHGVDQKLSTFHLAEAINAAITRVHIRGIDENLAEKNGPKDIVRVHTCKDDETTQFLIPNRKDATGLLKAILESQEIRVLGISPSNWGDNDGNYQVDPPVGFYPDLLDSIVEQLGNLSGPDNQIYGKIKINRIWPDQSSSFPWYKLFDGSAHITEPYFILDAPYLGSGKPCSNDNDCLNTSLTDDRTVCRNTCQHPARPRLRMLRSSCSILGTESKFLTRRTQIPDVDSSNHSVKSSNQNIGTIVGLVLISIFTVSLIVFIIFVIIRERKGSPFFYKNFN